jgi:hypothetical protein
MSERQQPSDPLALYLLCVVLAAGLVRAIHFFIQ